MNYNTIVSKVGKKGLDTFLFSVATIITNQGVTLIILQYG